MRMQGNGAGRRVKPALGWPQEGMDKASLYISRFFPYAPLTARGFRGRRRFWEAGPAMGNEVPVQGTSRAQCRPFGTEHDRQDDRRAFGSGPFGQGL